MPVKTPAFSKKICEHLKRAGSVDGEVTSRSIRMGTFSGVLGATATVATLVKAVARRVAFTRGRLKGCIVRLHDVDLWAQLPSNHICIAIVCWLPASVYTCTGLSVLPNCGHRDQVHGK